MHKEKQERMNKEWMRARTSAPTNKQKKRSPTLPWYHVLLCWILEADIVSDSVFSLSPLDFHLFASSFRDPFYEKVY